ncbi:MAG: zinc ribbon domain-containing protein [Solobacterium sp.]|nr:zinc ribbon domain-containing protein [Solobacterium sp.]
MIKCPECGTVIDETIAAFCPNCGTPVEKSTAAAEKSAIQEANLKPVNVTPPVKKTVRSQPVTTQKPVHSRYMSQNQLWSWLSKDSNKQIFFLPEGHENEDMTEGEFLDELHNKLVDNLVPAQITEKEIIWDDGLSKMKVNVVTPISDSINSITFLLSMSKVGRFRFVEEKTYITPPNLPKIPGKPKDYDPTVSLKPAIIGAIVAIIGLALIGVMGAISLLITLGGAGFAYLTYSHYMNNEQIRKYNEQCYQEKAAYEKAYNSWQNTVFAGTFQENTAGSTGRIYDAISECVKQVTDECFKDCKVATEDESLKISELKEQLDKHMQDYR